MFCQFNKIKGSSGTLAVLYNLKKINNVCTLSMVEDDIMSSTFSFKKYLEKLYVDTQMKTYIKDSKVDQDKPSLNNVKNYDIKIKERFTINLNKAITSSQIYEDKGFLKWVINLRSLEYIKKLREKWYVNNTKIVPLDFSTCSG